MVTIKAVATKITGQIVKYYGQKDATSIVCLIVTQKTQLPLVNRSPYPLSAGMRRFTAHVDDTKSTFLKHARS